MSTQDHPRYLQEAPGDDELLEPEMPRTELRQTVLMVMITFGFAVLSLAGALATDGTLNKVLILAAPAVLFIGAVATGVRALASRREGGRWHVYQGGMWLLLLIFLLWVFQAIAAAMA
ncbi:hypothetical protein [Gordonia caeni]|uniref:DUF4190 domain-containing protein n=1 Tax=Gordonia caeni TaxID=1007097 RepID=A0ABP7PPM1_9ACTN